MRKEKEKELQSYIEEFKTLRKSLVGTNSKFITVERYYCMLNNGMVIPREKIVKAKKDGSATIILPITKDGNTIVTVQPRVFTKSTVGVGLPAGYVESHEEYCQAAKRELKEETGYVPKELIELCSFYQDDGCSSAFNKGYLALDCEKKTNQNLDQDEYIKYFECTTKELFELVERGLISDCGSQLLIEKAKKYIK